MDLATVNRRAFTLVEMMIAVALGTALCAIAFAGLRLCNQAMSTTARLSDENRLMRAGVVAALDELDSWTSYDDPADPLAQPLRSGAQGAAFAPLLAPPDPHPESFDLDLRQSEPHTWYRGMGFTGDWTFGHFGTEWGMHQHLHHPDAERRWHPAMIRTLTNTLGYYGLLDYAPASTGFHYYLDTSAWVGPFWYDPEFFEMGPSRPQRMYNANNWRWQVRDIGGISAGSAFAVTTNPAYKDAAARRFFVNYIDYSKMGALPADHDDWRTSRMYERCGEATPLFAGDAIKPTHWPAVTATVRHFILSARWWNTAEVVIASPITGQKMRVWFSGTATTLRGARRNRGLDPADPP